MSKEQEILNKYENKSETGYGSEGFFYIYPEDAIEAMREHAKNECIAFKKWCDENTYMVDNVNQHNHTTEELYEIFRQL